MEMGKSEHNIGGELAEFLISTDQLLNDIDQRERSVYGSADCYRSIVLTCRIRMSMVVLVVSMFCVMLCCGYFKFVLSPCKWLLASVAWVVVGWSVIWWGSVILLLLFGMSDVKKSQMAYRKALMGEVRFTGEGQARCAIVDKKFGDSFIGRMLLYNDRSTNNLTFDMMKISECNGLEQYLSNHVGNHACGRGVGLDSLSYCNVLAYFFKNLHDSNNVSYRERFRSVMEDLDVVKRDKHSNKVPHDVAEDAVKKYFGIDCAKWIDMAGDGALDSKIDKEKQEFMSFYNISKSNV